MAGLSLHLSEKIFEEDQVKFSDGTSGKITKMGWFETMIQNSDDVVVAIPNSQLTGQRVYNLSRTPHSQVQQTLRIRYEDASKIPLLLETIKEEIRNDCDKLIPGRLRAHWSNFEDDHLQVVVDAHFSIKPTGVAYHDNRQKVLQAIYRAGCGFVGTACYNTSLVCCSSKKNIDRRKRRQRLHIVSADA
eukprot:scaffold2011_cov142-Skeletonema_menzelii.AAC.1